MCGEIGSNPAGNCKKAFKAFGLQLRCHNEAAAAFEAGRPTRINARAVTRPFLFAELREHPVIEDLRQQLKLPGFVDASQSPTQRPGKDTGCLFAGALVCADDGDRRGKDT